jgi:HK97 family phage prohead protease
MKLIKTLSLSDSQLKMSGNNATFTGYASVFGGVDSYGDTIQRGAFKKAIASGKSPKMFENHKSWELPIGKWLNVSEDSKGLYVEGELTPNHARADMVRAAMMHETIDGMSIGFRMSNEDYEENDKGRLIKNISDLVEISVVTFPADDAARVDLSSVKSELDTIMTITDLEAFLREAGGFSKGLAVALLARAKAVFGGEPQAGLDEKAMQELKRLLKLPPL